MPLHVCNARSPLEQRVRVHAAINSRMCQLPLTFGDAALGRAADAMVRMITERSGARREALEIRAECTSAARNMRARVQMICNCPFHHLPEVDDLSAKSQTQINFTNSFSEL